MLLFRSWILKLHVLLVHGLFGTNLLFIGWQNGFEECQDPKGA